MAERRHRGLARRRVHMRSDAGGQTLSVAFEKIVEAATVSSLIP
jgi:hypothetical protein